MKTNFMWLPACVPYWVGFIIPKAENYLPYMKIFFTFQSISGQRSKLIKILQQNLAGRPNTSLKYYFCSVLFCSSFFFFVRESLQFLFKNSFLFTSCYKIYGLKNEKFPFFFGERVRGGEEFGGMY